MIKLSTIYAALTGAYFTLYGGGKSSTPAAPDYRGAAEAQGASSRENTTAQTWANRPTLNTPWGQQTWQSASDIDPSTGQPVTKWESNINLTPEQQAALDSQQNIQQGRSNAAETLLGQATGAFQEGFDWEGLPGAPANLSDAQQQNFELQSQLFQPGRDQQQTGLNARMAAMGVDPNSEGYKRQQANLQEGFGRQDQQAMVSAMGQGRADVAGQMQLRQQAIAEEAQRRGMTLNELNALLTGQQVQTPQMPGFSQASKSDTTNYLGAAQMQGQYGLDKAAADAAGGTDIGSLVGAVGGAAMMFSDRRLKRKIVALGGGLYEFEYVWGGARRIGVMAQEVLRTRPAAVYRHPTGYLMVDYAEL